MKSVSHWRCKVNEKCEKNFYDIAYSELDSCIYKRYARFKCNNDYHKCSIGYSFFGNEYQEVIKEVGGNGMKQQYVICSRDNGTNRLVYYTGTSTFHGDVYFGNVLEAKRFDSLQEVAK